MLRQNVPLLLSVTYYKDSKAEVDMHSLIKVRGLLTKVTEFSQRIESELQ